MILIDRCKKYRAGFLLFVFLLTLFFYPVFYPAYPQTSKNKLTNQQKRLQNIQAEILELRKKKQQLKNRKDSSLDQLAQIDKESDLLRDLIRQLKIQENRLRKNIFQTNSKLIKLLDEYDKQKQIFAERLVHFYKHRNLGDIEILLASRSLNQALVWLKYSKRIADADRRRLKNLLETKHEIEKTNQNLRVSLEQKGKFLAEKGKEEKNLKKRRREKKLIVEKYRNDLKFIDQKLQQRERDAAAIRRFIRESEKSRTSSPIDLAKPTRFPQLKGKMAWPTRGKIIRKFGNVKHPKTKRLYFNPGIDIKAVMGQAVKATCYGVVTAITWQRSFGNIVIVNHYGGYYTVFTHLSAIEVIMGEEVTDGTIIGRVGDSGSLSGPMLHFEIWQKTTPVNPQKWLSRKPK
ncbi:MAG TPA: hypothetical protein ENH29_08220 [Bacteroidetes bacterium]|nr:hypothetical protein [Bacteroidota bacterium]